MKQELILITNRYPFYPGEEFLKLELDFLCEKFRKVHIIPVNSLDHSKQRELPANAEVHLVPGFQGKRAASYKLSWIHDRQGLKWFLSESGKAKAFGAKGFGKLASWTANAVKLRSYIENNIMSAENDADFVVYSYWLSLAPGIALLKEKYPSIHAYSRGHGGDIYEDRHKPPYLPFKQKLIGKLDNLFLISDNGRQYLSGQASGNHDHLETWRLGTLKPDGESPSSKDGTFRIVSCSYIVPVKRLELLINSLQHCEEKIHWTHIGDGPARAEIEQLAAALPDHVSCEFKGSLGNSEVMDFYTSNAVDMFVNVSSSEGIPVAIMEAFSCRIPALATDVGGTRELVNDRNGHLIPKDFDVKELAGIFDSFARSPHEDREKRREAAYQTWNELYNAKKNYSAFAEKLAGNGGTGS
ncbi:glycosyltransferase [Bacillus sp. REN3]|uniref:glycosyltransferase n=1 Tax=Bacillus sp. REN3 TaxID=2802440 RepID=UPI001AEE4F15|nr:glycosyltransferase [Bacillus sp. REN3]